jgi:PPIC-type PPIASE domain
MLALVSCGDGDDAGPELPAGVVARVGDDLITKEQVRAFLPAGSSREELRRNGARLVILFEWLKRDARREGLETRTSTTVKSSLSEADARTPGVVARATFLTLSQALHRHASGQPPSDADIARRYRANSQFAKPEIRFMRSVATDSRAQAMAAKRALEKGASWKEVIRRYSTKRQDVMPASGDMGAGLGEMPTGLDEALFAAHRGAFNGPVKTDHAWYVFELITIDRLHPQSLAQAREQIRASLQVRRSEQGRRSLEERLLDRYRAITVCAKGLQLRLCRNGPEGTAGSKSLLDF